MSISGSQLSDPPLETYAYFAGRRVLVEGQTLQQFSEDQLGSNAGGSLYPWAKPRSLNPKDTWSFATYRRDSATQLDYARNRYYSNAYGRFMTPAPYTYSGPIERFAVLESTRVHARRFGQQG